MVLGRLCESANCLILIRGKPQWTWAHISRELCCLFICVETLERCQIEQWFVSNRLTWGLAMGQWQWQWLWQWLWQHRQNSPHTTVLHSMPHSTPAGQLTLECPAQQRIIYLCSRSLQLEEIPPIHTDTWPPISAVDSTPSIPLILLAIYKRNKFNWLVCRSIYSWQQLQQCHKSLDKKYIHTCPLESPSWICSSWLLLAPPGCVTINFQCKQVAAKWSGVDVAGCGQNGKNQVKANANAKKLNPNSSHGCLGICYLNFAKLWPQICFIAKVEACNH